MNLRLDYERTGLNIVVPDGLRVSVLEPAKGTAIVDSRAALDAALGAPIGARPLVEIARGRANAVVVISDKTRPVPYGDILPGLLASLETAGVARERIEILVATGLHRPNDHDELVEMTSPEIVARYRFRNHIARNPDQHVHLGRSRRGTEIHIDRGFMEADLKIVTGLIEPHLMAGFSGGRKAVVPGLAGVETMRSAHGAAMLEANVGPGIVAGNPFHEDLLEIARRVNVDFMLDVSIDRERRITGVFAGDIEAAHQAGMEAVERHVRADLEAAADIVITSAGGYPLDATFYQSIKGLTAALNIVRRGGTIILVAALTETIGSADFQDLLASAGSHEEFMQRILSPGFFRVDQWMLQHLCQVLRKANVIVVSDGPAAGALPMQLLSRFTSTDEALRVALQRHGREAHIAVVPQGPYTLSTVRGRKLSLGRAWLDEAA